MPPKSKPVEPRRIENRWVSRFDELLKQLNDVQGKDDWSSRLKKRVIEKSIQELRESGLLDQSTDVLEKEFQQRLAKSDTAPTKSAVIPLDSRLYPQVRGRVNIMQTLPTRRAERWRLLRTFKKRLEVMSGQEYTKGNLSYTIQNDVDTCSKCGSDRYVDKETSNSVCSNPKCGDTRNFASHVFDAKDNDRDEHDSSRHQSLEHLKKFTDQYEKGHPQTPLEVLAKLSSQYAKFHFPDPSKVQSCRTNLLLKTCRDIPKVFRKAADRLSKELKAESIPEYSGNQINQLLNQRKRLRLPDDTPSAEEHKQKKSFNNQIYIRQLGRANDMEQARLHYNAKTNKIHLQRVWALEKECMVMQQKFGEQKDMSWSLYPST